MPENDLKNVVSSPSIERPSCELSSDSEDGLSSPNPPSCLVWDTPPSPFLEESYCPLKLPPEIIEEKLSKRRGRISQSTSKHSKFSKPIESSKKNNRKIKNKRRKASNPATNKAFIKSLIGGEKLGLSDPVLSNKFVIKSLDSATSREYFDPEIALSLSEKSGMRKKREIKFLRPGTFERKAHVLRAKNIEKNFDQSAENKIHNDEIDDEYQFFDDMEKIFEEKEKKIEETPLERNIRQKLGERKINDVEWWDIELLNEPKYDGGADNIKTKMITQYIQHPLRVKPVLPKEQTEYPTLFLTAHEKKKAKRMKKRAKLEIQAERIRLGLEEPPDPKVSLANVMRVLGNTAVQDPSAVERQVRAKVEKRRMTHLLQNELRKLSPAERKQKKRKSLIEHCPDGVRVALYTISSLASAKARFKIDVTATQYNLTGCCAIIGAGGLVLVEGGPKGMRMFKRMVLKRIDWMEEKNFGEESTDEESEYFEEENSTFGCRCIWEGIVQKRAFQMFTIQICEENSKGREIFETKNVTHYWDFGIRNRILRK